MKAICGQVSAESDFADFERGRSHFTRILTYAYVVVPSAFFTLGVASRPELQNPDGTKVSPNYNYTFKDQIATGAIMWAISRGMISRFMTHRFKRSQEEANYFAEQGRADLGHDLLTKHVMDLPAPDSFLGFSTGRHVAKARTHRLAFAMAHGGGDLRRITVDCHDLELGPQKGFKGKRWRKQVFRQLNKAIAKYAAAGIDPIGAQEVLSHLGRDEMKFLNRNGAVPQRELAVRRSLEVLAR